MRYLLGIADPEGDVIKAEEFPRCRLKGDI